MLQRRIRATVTILLLSAVAIPLASCNKSSGSSSPPPPKVIQAVFDDVNVSTSVDAGDTILVTFSKDVTVTGTPQAAGALKLTGATDSFGSSLIGAGPLTTQVLVTIGTGASFNPVGVYPVDPGASGIAMDSNNAVITYGPNNKSVPVTGGAVDIEGTFTVGNWTSIAATMSEGRFGHTATLLANGEILIVGGMHDVASSVTPGLREALDTIEVFDPATETFTLSTGTLVARRGYHRAVRTPGRDRAIDTNDDYVVVVGGWTDAHTDSAGGPRSEGSIEVIRPDWNGDGDTSDLVVNPDPAGNPTGAVVSDLGTATLPVDAGCTGVSVPIGLQFFDMQWVPAAGLVDPAGNNEILVQGGFQTFQWDQCAGGVLNLYYLWFTGTFSPPACENGVPYLAIDPNNDGDLSDSGIFNFRGNGQPLTAPVALTRGGYTQVRVAGPDGVDGTSDDVQVMYGGVGVDTTSICQTGSASECTLSDLEFFNLAFFSQYTGVVPAYGTCGIPCTSPGTGATDRGSDLVGVFTGNAQQDVVLLGGAPTNFPAAPSCTQAVEAITPNFTTPGLSTVGLVGLEALGNRPWDHAGAALAGSGNVLLCGGVDFVTGGTTASAEYIISSAGAVVTVSDMSEPRDTHAAVSVPAGFGGLPTTEDRIYIFGGINRLDTFTLKIGDPGTDPGTASATAEYFTQ